MFLLFCSRYDHQALWLYSQLKATKHLDTEILFEEDLYECKDWKLRLSNNSSYAAVTLPNGRLIDTTNVSLFLNRVRLITHPFWQKKGVTEQQYFQQEWNAFMLGWLQAFEPVLLNKPLPGYLAGYMPPPLRWQMLAKQAGFITRPQYFSSDNADIVKLQTSEIPAGAKTILVFNYKVFAPIAMAGLSDACIELAKTVDCKFLEVFVGQDKSGSYYFVSASSFPHFANYSSSFVTACKILASNASKEHFAIVEEELLLN